MFLNIFLSVIILPGLLQNYFVPTGYLDINKELEKEASPQRVYTDVLDIKTTAQSAIAVDVKSGKVLYQKNSQEVRSIASITKLMTALVFLEHNPGWQTEFSTIASDRRNGGIIHLNTGEMLTIRNLFQTALIASDNDATVALARSTGLSEEEFINKMNQKAQELGLINAEFADPTGLNNSNQATAEDIVKLVNAALANREIATATTTSSYEFEVMGEEKTRPVVLKNTDWLTSSYLDIVGGKTGYIEKAGYCLAVKLKGEQGQEIIVVVLGSATNFDRFQDVKAITDWVFTNYQWN